MSFLLVITSRPTPGFLKDSACVVLGLLIVKKPRNFSILVKICNYARFLIKMFTSIGFLVNQTFEKAVRKKETDEMSWFWRDDTPCSYHTRFTERCIVHDSVDLWYVLQRTFCKLKYHLESVLFLFCKILNIYYAAWLQNMDITLCCVSKFHFQNSHGFSFHITLPFNFYSFFFSIILLKIIY